MKTESLKNPNTHQLFNSGTPLKNVPKYLHHSEIEYCPVYRSIGEIPNVRVELDPNFSKPIFARPGYYYVSFAFDTGFSYNEAAEGQEKYLSATFSLQNLTGHHFTFKEYISISDPTQINGSQAELFGKLFGLSSNEIRHIKCYPGYSGKASLVYVTGDRNQPLPLLIDFLLDD
nr:hypothetical protein [uncultured Acetobacterium sp.]